MYRAYEYPDRVLDKELELFVLELMREIEERQRLLLNVVTRKENRRRWDAFRVAGGVTAFDLEQFLAGKPIPYRPSKKHLTVIARRKRVSRPKTRIRVSRPITSGDDAA
jgi:hypothetical protein